MLVVGDVAGDHRAVAGVGPEVLGAAPLVAGDDGVGGAQDALRRAVVLLEQDRARVGVVVLELEDVADRRAAEGVDRLVGVADDAQLGRRHGIGALGPPDLADELLDELVLRLVGVLVLVDEDVAEAAAVVLRDVGEGLQDVDGHHDDVVEVERVGLAQAALVLGVGVGDGALVVVALGDLAGVGLLVDELVLEVADLRREAARRVALRVEVEVAQHEAHEALAVGGVVDREGRLHADLGRLAAQDAHARRVERHDPHGPRPRPDERLDALTHLGRRLVGEGDREDLARLGAAARRAATRCGGSARGSCPSRRRRR